MNKTLCSLLFLACLAAPAAAEETSPPAQTSDHAVSAHLASYLSKGAAERGWHVLADTYSGVLYFKPAIREVDLPGKGHFFRLYADGDPEMVSTLCQSLKARKLYCVLHHL